jgi:hypothetical protein
MSDVFISFSGDDAASVGEILAEQISAIFSKVDPYLSKEKMRAGSFKQHIQGNMKDTKVGIGIYTKDNFERPWLMFEAGYMSYSCELNDGIYIPYFFTRGIDKIESPIQDLHVYHYIFDGNDDDNRKQFIKVLLNLNEKLPTEKREKDATIKKAINNEWSKSLSVELHYVAHLIEKRVASERKTKTIKSSYNYPVLPNSFATQRQFPIPHENWSHFSPKTPADIEKCFKSILETQVPEAIIALQTDEEKQLDNHRVMINHTRFSTFVAFTDGKKIVVFDRSKDPKSTNVTNMRFDMFGAVTFENRSIKNKIKSKAFFLAPIQKITPIFGVAVEDNEDKKDEDIRETAVMFGFCIFMKESDLELAKQDLINEEIKLFDISDLATMATMNPDCMTSKTRLAVSSLISG